MEPRIVTKPAFTIVGLPFTGLLTHAPHADGQGNNEIGLLWDEFHRRSAEIRDAAGPVYGLCFGMPNDREPWYLAGAEVPAAAEVPPGMRSMTVPAQKYAVFTCTLPTLWETYRYITEEWQARAGYEHAEAPDFELYDRDFDPGDVAHSPMYVYWPIK